MVPDSYLLPQLLITHRLSLTDNYSHTISRRLLHLKAWTGVDIFRKASTIKFINYEFRELLCKQRNNQGRTPLHLLAQAANSKELNVDRSKRLEIVIQILSWILDHDCPIDATDAAGDTALSLALKCNSHDLIELLLKVSSHSLRNIHFRSFTDLFSTEKCKLRCNQQQRSIDFIEYSKYNVLLTTPNQCYCRI